MGEVTAEEKAALELAERRARRVAIIDRLVLEGAERGAATMYADAFLEYAEATSNIEKNGAIVQHPRTMNPIDNPYLAVRGRARKTLQGMRWIRAHWLWEGG